MFLYCERSQRASQVLATGGDPAPVIRMAGFRTRRGPRSGERSMPNTKRSRLVASTIAVALGATALAACGSSDSDSKNNSGPVSLTYWTWTPGMDKVVDLWNEGPGKKDQITVTVKKQASGDSLITKILTAHKAGKAPDLVQAEYQALPTLVSNDALADISKNVGDAEGS